jgi:hypothetical protein
VQRALHGIQVAAKIAPGRLKGVGVLRDPGPQHLIGPPLEGGTEAGATVAGELERHTLPHLALRRGVEQERQVAMGVQIDKARRHHQSASIDGLCCLAFQLSEGRNIAVLDADIRPIRSAPCAIDDVSVFDEQVVHGLSLRMVYTADDCPQYSSSDSTKTTLETCSRTPLVTERILDTLDKRR